MKILYLLESSTAYTWNRDPKSWLPYPESLEDCHDFMLHVDHPAGKFSVH